MKLRDNRLKHTCEVLIDVIVPEANNFETLRAEMTIASAITPFVPIKSVLATVNLHNDAFT